MYHWNLIQFYVHIDANAHQSWIEWALYICEIKVYINAFSMLTQRHSCALHYIQGCSHSLKGIRAHAHSNTSRGCSFLLKDIHGHSIMLRGCLCTLNLIQGVFTLTQRHSHVLYQHSKEFQVCSILTERQAVFKCPMDMY